MSLFAQYVGISPLKTMEHFFQFFHIGSGQRVRRLPLLGDIIMGQDTIFSLKRDRGKMVVLRMLPAGRTDEKSIGLGHNILAGSTVVNRDDAFGGRLKQLRDGLGIIIVKSAEILVVFCNHIGIVRHTVFHRNGLLSLQNGVVRSRDDADMALPQQMVIQVLYAAKPRDPITVGFYQEDDPQVGAAVLHIIQNIVKTVFSA